MRRVLLLATVALVLGSGRLHAGTPDPVAGLAEAAMVAPEPVTAVLQGFAQLPDFEESGTDVEAALVTAGVPGASVIQQVLGGVSEIKKSGNSVEIVRAKPVVIPIVVGGETKGYVGLGTDARFRVSDDGKAVTIDKASGITVGTSSTSLYNLSSITVDLTGPAPKVTLTASWAFFSKTESFTLPPPAATPAAAPATTGERTVKSPGLAGALSGASGD